MKKKIILSLFLMILMSMIVYSIVKVEYTSPIDDFYLIKGGGVMGNISFGINATPNALGGTIANATLWTNFSGTWMANFTNTTGGTVNTKQYYLFAAGDNKTFYSEDFADGLVFIWNVQVYDNVTSFTAETVPLTSAEFTTFDNYSTGCVPSSKICIVVTAGRGRLVNYPVSALDGIANDTIGGFTPGQCSLNGSNDGFFYCNQTKITYNGTGTIVSTEILITPYVKVNYTITSNYRFAGANRTVYVEDAPSITLNLPTDSSYDSDTTININITVSGDDDAYQCDIYSNDTGNWSVETGTSALTNDTDMLTSKIFNEGAISWNARCEQSSNSNIYGRAIANYTVIVDTTNPVIALKYPIDATYQTTRTFYFNATVNDTNLGSCNLYLNTTNTDWNSSSYNETITSMTTTNRFNFSEKVFDADYNIKWGVRCNDSAGRSGWSSNYTVDIDTTLPKMRNNSNYTSSATNCKGFTVDFAMSEEVNLSFTYGLTSTSETWKEVESDFATNQTVTLTFNESYNTDFYANVTICDRAGNCNGTDIAFTEMVFPSPIGLCTGWTYWSIYDGRISLINLSEGSGADYVYWWNNSGRSWTYYSSASTGQGTHNLKQGDVVHFYESTNTTYFRNVSGSPDYFRNVTAGHIYFGLYDSYTLGNISHVLFLNSSGGNQTTNNSYYYGAGSVGELVFRVDYLSGFNNTNHEYVNSIYTWSTNNDTAVGVGPKNGIDTLWAYFPYNLTINFSTNGDIMGNWT